MIEIDLTSTINQLEGKLKLLSDRSIRFAAARSMTASVRKAQDDMKRAISSPTGPIEGGATRWTIGALQSTWARPDNLTAEVGFRSDTPRAAGRYLQPIIRGGPPVPKAVDRRTAAAARVGRATLVQSSAIKLTRQGNVPLKTLTEILSAAQSNAPGNPYFIAPVRRGSTTKAVFARKGGFIGRTSTVDDTITRLFTLDPNPARRRPTFPLHEMLRKSVSDHFPGHYRASLEAELRRAGFR